MSNRVAKRGRPAKQPVLDLPTLSEEALNDNERHLLDRARQMRAGVESGAELYRSFVVFARTVVDDPKRFVEILKLAGFTEHVASRIKVIVMSPQETFDAYAKGELGFRKALEDSREKAGGRSNPRGAGRKPNPGSKLLTIAKLAVEKGHIKPKQGVCEIFNGSDWAVVVMKHGQVPDKFAAWLRVSGEGKP